MASDSDATAVTPYVLSDWERTTYYNGISPTVEELRMVGDHPELLYRHSDTFPIPQGRYPHLPTKTILELLKAWKICYSAINTACFVTHGEDGKNNLGPVVIWIVTHPATTTAKNAHDASPDILALLKANGVEGHPRTIRLPRRVVIEWAQCSSPLAFSSVPHLRAALVTPAQHIPDPGDNLYEVSRRAEACATISDHLRPTNPVFIPDLAALARGSSHLIPTCPQSPRTHVRQLVPRREGLRDTDD
ncbi:hypothetical protein EDB89DRAFT_2064500 [Lactarius sanguifluus]|nr:hypothetical protein EDB89DRAFT_2064500 [Lactarius sanguifluus]